MLSLADRLELHELNARYADLIDHHDWDGLDAIFATDADFRIDTPTRQKTLVGIEAIKRYMANDARHPVAHHITNVYVDDLPTVRVHTRLLLVQADRGAESGEYDDDMVRTDAGWRVASRTYRFHGPVHPA